MSNGNGIVMSAAARGGVLALSDIKDQISAVQTRLSSGKRVNSAIDDPAAYFLSVGLTSRSSALRGLLTNLQTAQSTVDAANKGITAIQSLLASAQSIANQALQAAQSLVTVTGNNGTAFTTSSQIATTAGSSSRFKAGDTVTVNDGTTTATYTAANGDTVQTFLNAINGTSGLKVTASLNVSGQIQLAATSNVNVTIGGSINGAGGGTLNSISGLTAGATNYTTNTVRQNLAAQFDSLRSQIDLAAQDAGFSGVNFLTGSSLSVTFNETGSAKLSITGTTLTSAGLGVSASANQFQLDSNINTALTSIQNALLTLQSNSATFGSNATIMSARKDFINAMADTLDTGANAITGNDMNADSALLLALQTRQQIATTTLSMSQSSENMALRLFGL